MCELEYSILSTSAEYSFDDASNEVRVSTAVDHTGFTPHIMQLKASYKNLFDTVSKEDTALERDIEVYVFNCADFQIGVSPTPIETSFITPLKSTIFGEI